MFPAYQNSKRKTHESRQAAHKVLNEVVAAAEGAIDGIVPTALGGRLRLTWLRLVGPRLRFQGYWVIGQLTLHLDISINRELIRKNSAIWLK